MAWGKSEMTYLWNNFAASSKLRIAANVTDEGILMGSESSE